MERKHILVVGAGAIGGLYAAYLAKVAEVAVFDSNPAHVEAIRRHGLILSGRTESVAKLPAFAHAAEMGRRRFDAVVVLVKTQATEAAFHAIHPVLEGAPLVVTFQNGMGTKSCSRGSLPTSRNVSRRRATTGRRIHHLVHGEESGGTARGGRIGRVAGRTDDEGRTSDARRRRSARRDLGEIHLQQRDEPDRRDRHGRERRPLRRSGNARAHRRHGG
jgi:ketopantoate reductase